MVSDVEVASTAVLGVGSRPSTQSRRFGPILPASQDLLLECLEPQPPYELTGPVYAGSAVPEHMNTLVRGITGVLTSFGIATEEESDFDTFTDRVIVECGPDPVVIAGPDLAVWAKKP